MSYKPGIRDKLIGIFVLIKVIPLIVLAWFAWNEITVLFDTLKSHVNEMSIASTQTTRQVAGLASSNSIRALDVRSREAIEHLTTDTARQVADFLKARDVDIRTAALLNPNKETYQAFLDSKNKEVVFHNPWNFNRQNNTWEPIPNNKKDLQKVEARNNDNSLDFHYRPPEKTGIVKSTPVYLEMTFIDLTGKEQIKITTSDLLPTGLKDVSDKNQTFCRAENYFIKLKELKPGQIYVSEVIGAYVKTDMIGPYTPERAKKLNIDFHPETSGYAGKENPVGKKFKGLIRWAIPITVNNRVQGYVTLALDHTHVMEFTDHVVPTEERYSPISDAGSGNYAFMWDHKGRNISHPRDYFIVGYDPETGLPAIPWLEDAYYEKYRLSELGIDRFLESMPEYDNQSLDKVFSQKLVKDGLVGLDCRYLNFAPQCDGWNNLTQFGGSGSFVIHWSGLKKLTTAATIPYYTGQYGESPRGFGFITIGANVDEFHKPAMETAEKINQTEKQFVQSIEEQNLEVKNLIINSLNNTAVRLSFYTAIMVACVIAIAVLMASALTGKITSMIRGISRFQNGEMTYRLNVGSSDEMGVLGRTFNEMADSVQQAIIQLEQSKSSAENSNVSLKVLLSRIIDAMPSIIIGVDPDLKITLWNHEAARVVQKPFEMVDGKDLFKILPLLSGMKAIISSAIDKAETQKANRLETQVNGERAFFDVIIYPLIGKNLAAKNKIIDGAVLRIDNVTQRIYMEEMMVQTEKMQSIGGLAAGMAHEINNPLAGIIQSAQVIRNRIEKDLPANRRTAEETGVDLDKLSLYFKKRQIFSMMDSILNAGRRAADIVSNMLTFSRKSDSVFAPRNIEEILDQTIDILQKDYDLKKDIDFKKIKFIKNYSPDLTEVFCDSGKLQQVFFNILKNGAHALMSSHMDNQPKFEITIRQEEESVKISIADNGPGMPENIRNRIFEPFFTTKPVGVGTGLGLYVSYFIIVENHKGIITVESQPGEGTKFIIVLPNQQTD